MEQFEWEEAERIEVDMRSKAEEVVRMEAERWFTAEAVRISAERRAVAEEARISADAARLNQRGKLSWIRLHGLRRRGGRPQQRQIASKPK